MFINNKNMHKTPVTRRWYCKPASANTGTILCWNMCKARPGPLNGFTSTRNLGSEGICNWCKSTKPMPHDVRMVMAH